MLDTCCGFISKNEEEYDWANFDEKNIVWNSDILIEMNRWTENGRESLAWENYFSKAKIKYKPLLELQNFEDVKRLADEIKAMTF